MKTLLEELRELADRPVPPEVEEARRLLHFHRARHHHGQKEFLAELQGLRALDRAYSEKCRAEWDAIVTKHEGRHK